VEAIIKEAMERGEFEYLRGKAIMMRDLVGMAGSDDYGPTSIGPNASNDKSFMHTM
jgi:hypothetical protein